MRLILACGLAACVAREPSRGDDAGVAATPVGPPWLAWREGDEVVVMPLEVLDAAPAIEDADGARALSVRGGRVRVRGERVVVTWRGAGGATGARAVLEPEGPVTAPTWVPIVRYRPGGPGGATTDEAVRIR